eukprot:5166796-Amphidinium_carterae.1
MLFKVSVQLRSTSRLRATCGRTMLCRWGQQRTWRIATLKVQYESDRSTHGARIPNLSTSIHLSPRI